MELRNLANLAEEPIYFVNIDEMYDIIKHAHISTGYGGRNTMVTFLSRYANIMKALKSSSLFALSAKRKENVLHQKGLP